jgi:hypothetical protein
VILPARVGELRLHEQRIARDAGGSHRGAHRRLDVVLALVGGVDAPETGGQRQPRQLGGAILLPRRAVEDPRHSYALDLDEGVHGPTIPGAAKAGDASSE